MLRWLFVPLLLAACGVAPEVPAAATTEAPAQTPAVAGAAPVVVNDTAAHTSFAPSPVKKPSGIYQCLLPSGNNQFIIHTVAFYPGRFRLQEEYTENRDSIVVTTGTWAPSQGYIWLYKDHVVRGRYRWRGDTLEYFSPRLKRHFPLERPLPVVQNKAWQAQKKEGAILYGVGTEPFWSVELRRPDWLVLNMPDWPQPLRTKIIPRKEGDQQVYTAADSLQLTVLPYFCSDDMSDFIYTKKLVLLYKGKTYEGCGEVF